jgi:VCBS repeat protein/fibronectin type III domain protein
VPTYNLLRVLSLCLICLALSVAAHAASLTLAWDPNREPDIAGYVVYWGTQPGEYPYSWNVGNFTSQQVEGLADATTYYFVVKAYNTSGLMSAPSAEVSGRTSGGSGGCTTCGIAPDFNGDSKPDLVWLNDSTRQAVVWYLGGSQGNVFQGWDWLSSDWIAGWTIVGMRDFNGDGKPDLVWQNDATQQVVVWYLGGPQGNSFLGWDWLGQDGVAGWYVVATGDLNGDGKPDLVWQNDARQVAVWYMGGAQGNTLLWGDWLSSTGVTDWRVVGTGDFNGDGRLDLVWQHDWTRQAVVWYMGGAQGNIFQSLAWLTSADVGGWTLVGTADFNGDGKPDLVWQNDETRELVVWYEGGDGGNSYLDWNWLGLAYDPVPGWRVIAR